jgi:hypothetical protein
MRRISPLPRNKDRNASSALRRTAPITTDRPVDLVAPGMERRPSVASLMDPKRSPASALPDEQKERGPGIGEHRNWKLVDHVFLDLANEIFDMRDLFEGDEEAFRRPRSTAALLQLYQRFMALQRAADFVAGALSTQLDLARDEDRFVAEHGKTSLQSNREWERRHWDEDGEPLSADVREESPQTTDEESAPTAAAA